MVALADPQLVAIGGTWGRDPAILDAINARFRRQPRHVQVRAARLVDEPSLTGARDHALHELRSAIAAMPRAPGAGR